MKRRGGRLLAVLLCAALETPVQAQPDCVDAPPPPKVRVNPNNGLPALGTMVLAVGTAMGLFSVFLGAAGAVLAVERSTSSSERNLGLAATGVLASGLLAVTFVTLVLGGSIWLFAWLPPPTDTRVRCAPPNAQGPT